MFGTMRRLTASSTALLVALVAAAGCGNRDDSTPVACLKGTSTYLDALAAAPGAAELEGDVPIGECLAANQAGGDLATVGAAMVEVAAELNTKARAKPGGAANLRLGYLVGAAKRRAEQTGGIHADLVRRLESAALYSPEGQPLPPRFLPTYERGLRVGEARG